MEIKKNIPNNTVTRKLSDLDCETGNIYESSNIIARRANQISSELKSELNRKLADFSSPTDTMEETFENREQIEISRYYERLHEKTYLNAYTYYKIGRHKSAIVALKNALRTYPTSKYREEIMFLIGDSSYQLADNSVASKQTDRYLSMMDSYLSFREVFPESKHMKEVERMAKHARDYLDQHVKEENN